MNVRDLMRRSATFYDDKPAIIAGDVRLTFGEAWERGLRMANALISAGLKPGDFCGSLEDNHHMAVDFFLGCTIAGVVRVPLYARNAKHSHAYMLEHTNCKVLITDQQHFESVEGLDQEISSLDKIIIRDASYEEWLASFSAEDPNPEIKGEDLYVIRHTGGTEGKSKGIPFSHKSWLDIGRNWFYTFPPIEEGDVCMHIAPISHASGYQFIPMWLQGGVNMVVQKYSPQQTADDIINEKVSYVFMVPTMLNDIMNLPGIEERNWSQLKALLIGAAPITEVNLRRAYAIFGECICSLYGQSEGVPVVTCRGKEWVRDDLEGSNPARSLGHVHPFCEVKIVDPDTNMELAFGEEGEICFRNDGQLPYYWENPEATAKAIIEGYVHTGDMGYLDRNGYLYMCDRKDDMILSGGFNIWPAELENVISAMDGVKEVVVIGVPDERFGEVPHAIVTLTEEGSVSEEEIISLCADKLGSYKKPGSVELSTAPIPRTPVGKLSRKMLRKPFWEKLGRLK